ncbi:MAG: hypothetical protein E6J34_02630 [Chloroflexi bacterium]|nr:MAG: hypothetical protein E6J34_02630 [Chloroflexota bacterium]
MGIYLGQLPPAEIARLKAELAETLIANFCYPRFFDPRTQSLRMRPVDRAKRQEVWLFLSSFDFTAWSRIDLTSPELQMYIERLFIQFVQRNRNFFGEQGRRRMSDIRMLISTNATSVCQGLRNHITGQRQGGSAFGSPRSVVSWSTPGANGRSEPTWEQIATSTMFLQQQIQEWRGEVKPAPVNDGRATSGNAVRGTAPHRPSSAIGNGSNGEALLSQVASATPALQRGATSPLQGSKAPATAKPAATAPTTATYRAGTSANAISSSPAARPSTVTTPEPAVHNTATPTLPLSPEKPHEKTSAPPSTNADGVQAAAATSALQTRNVPQTIPAQHSTSGFAANQREASMLTVAEEDLAIFEQMRHQLMLWLRVETVRAGLDLASQSPSQLLELLRQQGTFDETRLQVISSLLNLSNQVVKTRQVTMMDYRQALMFYLMHTRL